MSLLELQREVRAGILDAAPAALLARIAADGLDVERRLQIYRNNTLISLTEALRTTFPVATRLVGEKFFAFAADRFIRAHPPQAPRLIEYGATFPRFLAAFEPAGTLPYLPDVARLEWAVNAVYNAPDEPPLEPAALATVPEELYAVLRFSLRSGCRSVASPYPIKRIWLANQVDAPPETIYLDAGGVELLVMRRGFDVMLVELEPGELAFLAALDAGKTVEAAFADAVAAAPDFHLAETLARQFARGSLGRVVLPDPSVDIAS
jgi:Putative DNA-binding domain